VLCVRRSEGDAPPPYRRLVVPIDFSEASRRSSALASLLARAFQARVIVVYVVPPHGLEQGRGRGGMVPMEAALSTFVQGDFGGLELQAQVHAGRPWEEVVRVAQAEAADLVVASRRGWAGPADRLLGTQAERIVRHAGCPVLVA
jgi:nucleotide-binding universal stress UspA family protein